MDWILNMDWVAFWLIVSALSMMGIFLGSLYRKVFG